MKSDLKDSRPKGYLYFEMLKDHLGGDMGEIFSGNLVYPRQAEFHLPGDGTHPCNFNCYYCQAWRLKKDLGHWEKDALSLIDKLGGKIRWLIFGGQYTEPLLNPYFLDFVIKTKKWGSHYGLHTNGSLIKEVAHDLARLATSAKDFVTCSLDAGFPESHAKIKNLKSNEFNHVIEGLETLMKFRGAKSFPAVRVTYLMNKQNAIPAEIKNAMAIMRRIKPDTFRFSIPYDHYGKNFSAVKRYRKSIELKYEKEYFNLVAPYLSQKPERPFIFWLPTRSQDVNRLTFERCIYGYFAVTFGADGWMYRCPSVAASDFKSCRLGRITSDLGEFKQMIAKGQDPDWKPIACYKQGGRCNRVAIEINDIWRKHDA